MTDHFTTDEKSCHCGCGLNLVDQNPRFLQALNTARELAGVPFPANSMTRCVKHNAAVGGETNSAHLRGLAADIACTDSRNRERILFGLFGAGFTRIGVGKTFIHVDMDASLPQEVIWVYS